MNPTAKKTRACIAVILKHASGGRRYGAELKRAVVDYALARQGERATIREISEEFGLSTRLLGKWLRRARLQRRPDGLTRVTTRRRNAADDVLGAVQSVPEIWPRPESGAGGS